MPGLTKIKIVKKPATGQEIYDITGQMDHKMIAAILHTGATFDEVLQAYQYLEENYYTKPVFIKHMTDRVRHVYDILDYSRDFAS